MSELSRHRFTLDSSGAGIGLAGSAVSASCPPASRLFSDMELDVLATPLSIRLERAARNRDNSEIAQIRGQMDLECLAIYDSYMQWVAVLQTFIVAHAGETRHDEALREMGEHAFRDYVLAYRDLDTASHVRLLASRLRASGSTFHVSELTDRVRFAVNPFGAVRQWRSGQPWQVQGSTHRDGDRFFYPCYGAYQPPISFTVLERARPLTQSRAALPCFLAAEILFLETLPTEYLGHPIAVITLPGDLQQEAYLDVYKDCASVPVEVYARVGTSKPPAGFRPKTSGQIFSDQELRGLGTPLSIQVEQAAARCDWDMLADIAAGMDEELVGAKDPLGLLINGLLTWIARHLGEDAVEAALRRTAEVVMEPYISAVRALNIKEAIPMWAMVWRSHGSTFSIEEGPSTFIFRGRPLGACARMWAHRYQTRVARISESRVRYRTFGAYDAPMCCYLMREPRGITHGKAEYPVYSTHCHMLHEIYPIDRLGYPLWVEYHPIDDPDGETVHLHYKNPADWPPEAYERVGRRKGV
jgi:hypothetical protein